jgi:hypothetical protein
MGLEVRVNQVAMLVVLLSPYEHIDLEIIS